MTKVEELFCKKMYQIGQDIIMRRHGEKFITINSSKELTEEQCKKYDEAGIGALQIKNYKVFYYKDDFIFQDSVLKAKRPVVKSIPVTNSSCIMTDVIGQKFDLTDFVGITGMYNIHGNEIIIGEDCRITFDIHDYNNSYNYLGHDHYFEIPTVKVISKKPILSMCGAFSLNYEIKHLDLTQANLTECKNFKDFCLNTKNLETFECGRVNADANFEHSFRNARYYPIINADLFRMNAFERAQVLKKDLPRLVSIIDTKEFKVAATNLTEKQITYLFPEYKFKIISYKRNIDVEEIPYVFLFENTSCFSQQMTTEIEKLFEMEFPALHDLYKNDLLKNNCNSLFEFVSNYR